jgi:Concanavalin A-like lectin/glucanases superfamily
MAIDLACPVNLSHPLALGLTSWWLVLPQWAGGTTWLDLCKRNPGTLHNFGSSTTNGWNASDRQGGFGHLALDGGGSGSHDYVTITAQAFSASADYTICMWMYPQNLAAVEPDFLSNGQSPDNDYLSFGTGGNISLSTIGPGTIACSPAFADNAWQHFAMTAHYSGAGDLTTIYRNGLQVGSSTLDTSALTLSQLFGNAGLSEYLQGKADDVRFYTRVLSANEVLALYHNTLMYCPGLLRRVDVAGSARVHRLLTPPIYDGLGDFFR